MLWKMDELHWSLFRSQNFTRTGLSGVANTLYKIPIFSWWYSTRKRCRNCNKHVIHVHIVKDKDKRKDVYMLDEQMNTADDYVCRY